MTIDQTIIPDPYEYIASQTADVQTLLDSAVVSSELSETCPYDLEFTLTKQDGSAFDGSVFTFDNEDKTITTYTNDTLKIGIYPLSITVNYAGHPIVMTNKLDFTVEVINPGTTLTNPVYVDINALNQRVYLGSSLVY